MRQPALTAITLAVSLAFATGAALAQRAGTAAGSGTAGASSSAAPAATGTSASSTPASTGATQRTTTQSQTNGPASSGVSGGTGTGSTSPSVVTSSIANLQGAQIVNANGQLITNVNGQPLTLDARGMVVGITGNTGTGSTSPGVVPSSIANLQGVQIGDLQGAQIVNANGQLFTNAAGQPLTFDARGQVVGVAPFAGNTGTGTVVGFDNSGAISNGGMATNGSTNGGVGTNGATGMQPNGQVMMLNGNLVGSVTSTPELDRATRKEQNKARIVAQSRNKQLLYTIAPRSNVDRTDQMADDPPSPALSTPDRGLPRY